MLLNIHPENSYDYLAITKVNYLAFRQLNEGKLVEYLRKNRNLFLNHRL